MASTSLSASRSSYDPYAFGMPELRRRRARLLEIPRRDRGHVRRLTTLHGRDDLVGRDFRDAEHAPTNLAHCWRFYAEFGGHGRGRRRRRQRVPSHGRGRRQRVQHEATKSTVTHGEASGTDQQARSMTACDSGTRVDPAARPACKQCSVTAFVRHRLPSVLRVEPVDFVSSEERLLPFEKSIRS